eukprot:CAMPEP_0119052636 /NCGR_PEP_ID=MMETSP1177-20130426/73868_1 /TAXON_ID=2985 /ORGANISM="Ochromonas sp, Strain CCMP1899" /LENGTH=318 /DNA_ID=CAMNT_0007032273 /DNA_START=550 /DNA_END=1505 /DNA_ORIENTATION=-
MPSDNRTGLHVGNFGLGGYGRGTPGNMRSLGALMKENNHTYIDILKMDIEGFEWSFLEKEDALLERVGVFLVEVHRASISSSSSAPKGPMRSTHAAFHRSSREPCIRGVVPIGSDSKVALTEGHKYGCGIHMIKSSPIVYSFGSNKNTEFEIDVLNLRSDANVWIYELDPARMPSDKRTGLHVGNFGLGGYGRGTPGNMRSLGALMKENNHTYIDILKIDIEGFEWSWLEKEDALLERVGVFLVEVHSILASISSRAPKGPMRSTHAPFIEAVEKRDLRLYHQEINAGSHKCCSEYAFIQKNTSMWDSKTKFQFLSLL